MNKNSDLGICNRVEGSHDKVTHMPMIDRSRKDDLTTEELQQIECFRDYSLQQLKAILETVKAYTSIIISIYNKEKGKSIKFHPNNNHQKRAA